MGPFGKILDRLDMYARALFFRLPPAIQTRLSPIAYWTHARIRRLVSPDWVGPSSLIPAVLERSVINVPAPPRTLGPKATAIAKTKIPVFREPFVARWIAQATAHKSPALTIATDAVGASVEEMLEFIEAIKAQFATCFHLSIACPTPTHDAVRTALESAHFSWSILDADNLSTTTQRLNAQIGASIGGLVVLWPDVRFLPEAQFVEMALFQCARAPADVYFFCIDDMPRIPFLDVRPADLARLGPLSPIVALARHPQLRLRELLPSAPLVRHAKPEPGVPEGASFFNTHSLAFTWCDAAYLLPLWDLFTRMGDQGAFRTILHKRLIRITPSAPSLPGKNFDDLYAQRHAALHYLVTRECQPSTEPFVSRSRQTSRAAREALAALPAMSKSKAQVLCCLPYRVRGNLTLRILEEMDRLGVACYILSQFETPQQYEEDDGVWSRTAAHSFRLSEMGFQEAEWLDLVRHIIRSRRINTVLVAGASEIYAMLPALTSEFKHTRFVDQLFNPVGHTRRHLTFKDYFDEVIVENDEMVRFLAERGVPVARISKIYSGVDLAHFSAGAIRDVKLDRSSLGFDPSVRVVVGYVGRMSWEKNPMGFLQIAESLMGQSPTIGVLIAGGGPQSAEVAQRAGTSLPAGRVVNLGFVEDVRSAISICDIIVLPSLVDGLPGLVQEANALGVPVVGARVGGIPEMIVDGVTGYLFASGQYNAAAEIVAALAADTAGLTAMKKRARQHVATKFASDRMYNTYFEVLTRQKLTQRTALSSHEQASKGTKSPKRTRSKST